MLDRFLGDGHIHTHATNQSDHSDNDSWHSCNQSNASSPSASSIKSHARYFNVSPKFPTSPTLDSDSPYSPSDDFRYDNRYDVASESLPPHDSRADDDLKPEPEREPETIPAFEPAYQPAPAPTTHPSPPPESYPETGPDPEWDHPALNPSRVLFTPETGHWSPRPEPDVREPHFSFRVPSPRSEVPSTSPPTRLTGSPPPPHTSLHSTPLFPPPPKSPLGRSGATSASPSSAASANKGSGRGERRGGRGRLQRQSSPQGLTEEGRNGTVYSWLGLLLQLPLESVGGLLFWTMQIHFFRAVYWFQLATGGLSWTVVFLSCLLVPGLVLGQPDIRRHLAHNPSTRALLLLCALVALGTQVGPAGGGSVWRLLLGGSAVVLFGLTAWEALWAGSGARRRKCCFGLQGGLLLSQALQLAAAGVNPILARWWGAIFLAIVPGVMLAFVVRNENLSGVFWMGGGGDGGMGAGGGYLPVEAIEMDTITVVSDDVSSLHDGSGRHRRGAEKRGGGRSSRPPSEAGSINQRRWGEWWRRGGGMELGRGRGESEGASRVGGKAGGVGVSGEGGEGGGAGRGVARSELSSLNSPKSSGEESPPVHRKGGNRRALKWAKAKLDALWERGGGFASRHLGGPWEHLGMGAGFGVLDGGESESEVHFVLGGGGSEAEEGGGGSKDFSQEDWEAKVNLTPQRGGYEGDGEDRGKADASTPVVLKRWGEGEEAAEAVEAVAPRGGGGRRRPPSEDSEMDLFRQRELKWSWRGTLSTLQTSIGLGSLLFFSHWLLSAPTLLPRWLNLHPLSSLLPLSSQSLGLYFAIESARHWLPLRLHSFVAWLALVGGALTIMIADTTPTTKTASAFESWGSGPGAAPSPSAVWGGGRADLRVDGLGGGGGGNGLSGMAAFLIGCPLVGLATPTVWVHVTRNLSLSGVYPGMGVAWAMCLYTGLVTWSIGLVAFQEMGGGGLWRGTGGVLMGVVLVGVGVGIGGGPLVGRKESDEFRTRSGEWRSGQLTWASGVPDRKVCDCIEGGWRAPQVEPHINSPPPSVQSTYALFAAILLLVVLSLGTRVITAPSPTRLPPGHDLRVMSFNVQQGFGRGGGNNFDAICAIIQEQQPHIVLLQESDLMHVAHGNLDMVDYLATWMGMYSLYTPPTTSYTWGCAILSRIPFAPPSSFQTLPSPAGENACFQHATFSVWDGMVHVFNTHFGDLDSDVALQAQRVAEMTKSVLRAPGDALIIGGDINAAPLSAAYNELLISSVYDTQAETRGPWNSTLDRDPGAGYIFASRSLKTTSWQEPHYSQYKTSDGFPVIATFVRA